MSFFLHIMYLEKNLTRGTYLMYIHHVYTSCIYIIYIHHVLTSSTSKPVVSNRTYVSYLTHTVQNFEKRIASSLFVSKFK